MRLTRKVFHDLAIWMIALGVLVGIGLPFFVVLLDVPEATALDARFVAATVLAGLLIGLINYRLVRQVVRVRVRRLSTSMRGIEEHLRDLIDSEELEDGRAEISRIPVDSDDEFGESAEAFNNLVEALGTAMKTQAGVRRFTEMIASQLELETLTTRALAHLTEHAGASAGALLSVTGGTLTVLAAHGVRSPEALTVSDHVLLAVRQGLRQRVVLPSDLSLEGILADFRPREIIVEPIRFKNLAIGAFVLAAPTPFPDKVVESLDLFGHGLGLALNNALVHDHLQRMAALDNLTGLYNRRFGEARLHEDFQRVLRSGEPLGVLMLDIDHFKAVNDTYGHQMGDRVIQAVARTVKRQIREGDVAIRYGGEEFLVLLPAASKADAAETAERIRRAVADTVVVDGEQRISVTISAGVTSCPELDTSSEEDLVARADEALYAAKQAGRDRVMALP